MFSWLWRKPPPAPVEAPEPRYAGLFSTHSIDSGITREELAASIKRRTFQRTVRIDASAANGYAMDDNGNSIITGADPYIETVSEDQLNWYGAQSFIGHQTCAILAQHWLIDRACQIPARDYCRNGWEISENGGNKIGPEVFDFIRKQDKAYGIKQHLVDFAHFGRVFGLRFALPIVNGGPQNDPEFYKNPFNIDGVKPNSYRGISQIDPYWVSPQLNGDAASNPAATDFYEPTWWTIAGKPVHKSHLRIIRNGAVPDILKPTYFYGGVSIPQKIAERVYAAERTANEAPLLALTKRLNVLHADRTAVIADPDKFRSRMAEWVYNRDNYGVRVIGPDETIEQLDTALTELDTIIFGQYTLVAAAAGIPVTKLMATPPKGMDATGEYDEANYHEMLESMQEHDGTPLLDRHYEIMIRSDVIPKFGTSKDFEVVVAWKELDAMTAKEQAEVNKLKADTDVALSATGAIDGQDIRRRIISDPASGYNGIEEKVPELPEDDPLDREEQDGTEE